MIHEHSLCARGWAAPCICMISLTPCSAPLWESLRVSCFSEAAREAYRGKWRDTKFQGSNMPSPKFQMLSRRSVNTSLEATDPVYKCQQLSQWTKQAHKGPPLHTPECAPAGWNLVCPRLHTQPGTPAWQSPPSCGSHLGETGAMEIGVLLS